MTHCWCPSPKVKLMHTIKFVILFLIFSSPMTYKIIRKVFGPLIATVEGLPHPTGMALHATLFGLALYFLMGMHCGKGCMKGGKESASGKKKGASYQDSIMGANLSE